jgi:hypothetical protein
MSSFEWMELQTLTSDIAASRSRLAAARASKDNRLTRTLEQEITAAEERRNRLLAHITNHVAGAEDEARESQTKGEEPATMPDQAEEAAGNQAASEQEPKDPGPPSVDEAARPAAAPEAGSETGGTAVWDQLTPGDIERAKNDLDVRRAEMLARHAEELRSLETDQAQLDGLVQAIDAFARKFKLASQDGAAVVTLDEERGLRAQGRG